MAIKPSNARQIVSTMAVSFLLPLKLGIVQSVIMDCNFSRMGQNRTAHQLETGSLF